ncbi:hypothetical protein HOC01_05530 [archaeon]|jgi:hypothetical protein|nr:hypothetical protein [archaeon]MBT6697698.1 hypothetical protein [archaeon]
MDEDDPLALAAKLSCDYCSTSLLEDKWNGSFEGDHEYIHQSCSNNDCLKEKWIKIDLGGFDPRDWHKRIASEVVSSAKKVYEKE